MNEKIQRTEIAIMEAKAILTAIIKMLPSIYPEEWQIETVDTVDNLLSVLEEQLSQIELIVEGLEIDSRSNRSLVKE